MAVKIQKKIIKNLLLSVFDKSLPPESVGEKVLLEELRQVFDELPIESPASFSDIEPQWAKNMRQLRELVLYDNPRRFLRWDVIQKTMFVDTALYIIKELRFLRQLTEWKDLWRNAIIESPSGHPVPYWLFPCSSGNLIHHAYHVAQFEQHTRMLARDMEFIFEFGGGYGSLCRLFHNLGFQGKYLIFDLPHFSQLQRFYLKSIGIEVLSPDVFESAPKGVCCISGSDELQALLVSKSVPGPSVFIATWSLSETPINFRCSILERVSKFNGFLIGYQEQFEGINNAVFFGDWTKSHTDVEWRKIQIKHLKRNSYLFGKRCKAQSDNKNIL